MAILEVPIWSVLLYDMASADDDSFGDVLIFEDCDFRYSFERCLGQSGPWGCPIIFIQPVKTITLL